MPYTRAHSIQTAVGFQGCRVFTWCLRVQRFDTLERLLPLYVAHFVQLRERLALPPDAPLLRAAARLVAQAREACADYRRERAKSGVVRHLPQPQRRPAHCRAREAPRRNPPGVESLLLHPALSVVGGGAAHQVKAVSAAKQFAGGYVGFSSWCGC